MAATQASTKRGSLMLGNDTDDTQLVLKTFYSRRDEQRKESNVKLTKLVPMTTQSGGQHPQKWLTQGVWRFENKGRA